MFDNARTVGYINCMEQICFTIPFGDTTDPKKIALGMAKELQFCSWMVRKTDNYDSDEGIAATKFVLMGWTKEK